MFNWKPMAGRCLFCFLCLMLVQAELHSQPRVTNGLQALYTFTEGTGSTVLDNSGIGVPLNLTIQDAAAITWLQNGGLRVGAPTVIATQLPAAKITTALQLTGQLTLEAWIAPANTTQNDPSRIISLSQNGFPAGGNFLLGQEFSTYQVRVRTSSTNQYGSNFAISTSNNSLTTNLTHVLYTRDTNAVQNIYINGVLKVTKSAPGNFSTWGDYQFSLANEPNLDRNGNGRPWLGDYFLIAVYDRALSNAEAIQNFNAGLAPNTQFNLQTNIAGTGSGNIVLSPAGGVYNENTQVSVTAVPDAGSVFSGWSGDLIGLINPQTITMDANKTITATFTQVPQFGLTISTNGTGTGSVTLNPAGGIYNEGTQVVLTAIPDAGSMFSSWSGDLTGVTNPQTLTMDSEKFVTATFTQVPQFTLAVINTGSGSGSVALNPGGGIYNEGIQVQLTAIPAAGSIFNSWSGDLTGSVNPTSINMDSNKNVTADFVAQFSVVISTTGSGTGSVQLTPPGGLYDAGTQVIISATPGPNSVLSGWSGDLLGTDNPDTIVVNSNFNITATFLLLYDLNVSISGGGSGSITLNPPGGSYEVGTQVTLQVVPSLNSVFENWSGDLAGTINPETILMDSDKFVTAILSSTAPPKVFIDLPNITAFKGDTVAIPVSVTTDSSLSFAQVVVEYDSSKLGYLSANLGAGLAGFSLVEQKELPFAALSVGTNKNFLLQTISSSNSFSGQSVDLFIVQMVVIGNEGDVSPLNFDSDATHTSFSSLNGIDIAGPGINFSSGNLSISLIPRFLVSGNTLYCETNSPILNTSIDLQIDANLLQTTSNSLGGYTFSNVPGGASQLTAVKTADIQSEITGSDVVKLQRFVAFFESPTTCQFKAADVSQDNSLTGSDVLALLRYLAFFQNNIGSTGEWRFSPSDTSFNLASDTVIDFAGVLLGDANLSWGNSVVFKGNEIANTHLELSEKKNTLKDFWLQVSLNGVTTEINSIIFTIEFGEGAFKLKDIIKAIEVSGFEFVYNTFEAGKIHFAMSSARGLEKDAKLLELRFTKDNFVSKDVPKLTKAKVNDADVMITKNVSLNQIPDEFSLLQNYPNPFNPTTTIEFTVPGFIKNTVDFKLSFFNTKGELLLQKRMLAGAGRFTYTWDATDRNGIKVPSGIYFYKIESKVYNATRKMTLLK